LEQNIICLTSACTELSIPFDFIDEEHNVLSIRLNEKSHYFHLNRTPFNSESVAGICKDKYHTYCLLRESVRLPKTLSFMSYNVDQRYKDYLKYHSPQEILTAIESELSYPLIIKSNSGSFGSNVFLCKTRTEAQTAIERIFNKNSHLYDYILLAQEFIPAKEEYRLVCFREEPVLTYKRSSNPSEFNARYWENSTSQAVRVTEQETIYELQEFVRPIYGKLPIDFVGFDIIRSFDDNFYLLELNSGPRFDHFIDSNGPEHVVHMYKNILSIWASKASSA
jgi:glutathione synthase/RimK-type ligase-like ATP-grasp enzyme